MWTNRFPVIQPDLINVCNWACLVIGTNKHLGCSWWLAPALTTLLPPRGEASLCRGLLCQARLKGVHKTAADFMTHNMQYFICRQGLGSEFSGLLHSHVVGEEFWVLEAQQPPLFISLLCFQEALSSFLSTFGAFCYFCHHVSATCFEVWLVLSTLCQEVAFEILLDISVCLLLFKENVN